MNKCVQPIFTKVFLGLMFSAVCALIAGLQQPTPGQNNNNVSDVAGEFSALRIREWLLHARATVLGKEISRGLKLGMNMEETNYAG